MPESITEAETATATPVVAFKKRGARARGNIRQKPVAPVTSRADSASDDSSSDSDSDDGARQGPRVKRRRKDAAVSASTTTAPGSSSRAEQLLPTTFKADRSAPITHTDDATKRSNWYEEDDKAKGGKGGKTAVGPQQSSTNVRRTTVIDFAPDVCKDYKKTGWCGFGDNCKFLHDRGDFKQGWELDRDWENVTQGKKSLGGTLVAKAGSQRRRDDRDRSTKGDADADAEDDEETMLENIPFACIICEGSYKAPVVTQCGHYFCEPCALKRYRKDPSCAACGAGTNGVFNTASKLKKLMERKREREALKRQAGEEDGASNDDDE